MNHSVPAPLSIPSLVVALAAVTLGVALLSGLHLTVDVPLAGPLGPLRMEAEGGAAGALVLLVGLLGTAAVIAARRDGLDRLGRGLVLLFLISLAAVPLAGDVFGFMLAWEAMSAAPGLLLILSSVPGTRRAGVVYLVYAHVSALALLIGLLLWSGGGDGTFETLLATPPPTPVALLILLGCLVKAGVMPFHHWLPEAHPAAPSHVSALMSGVMVAQPAYVVLRLLAPGGVPPWAATIVLLLGALSSALASLHALNERDMKRLLAMTTVAHLGVAFTLLGLLLLLGPAADLQPHLASATLLYLVAHGLAKGSLFLIAGEVHHATGRLDLELLGGLWRSLGGLALTAGLGGLALVGLPPFAGFPAEVALFTNTFSALPILGPLHGVILLGALFLLGVGAGADLAAVAKLVLGAFHGAPRLATPTAALPRGALLGPAILLALSLVLGLVPGLLGSGLPAPTVDAWTLPGPLTGLTLAPLLLLGLGLASVGVLATRRLRRPRPTDAWATGGPPPTPRQTYTPQALVMPYRILFAELLRPSSDLRLQDAPIAPFAPSKGQYEDPNPRYIESWIHRPLLALLLPPIERLRKLHRGPVQSYLIIALLALVLLLFLLPVIR